jgi:hypothetical protein
MAAADTLAALAAFERRGAGTDAERRAAVRLSRELQSSRRDAALETFWCRPNWALAHAWHVGLALAGSLVSIGSPRVGGAFIIVALLSLACDVFAGVSLGRRLSREHASQNVVSRPAGERPPVRLIITANYDAGRTGLVYRSAPRRLAARLRRSAGDGALTPGWLGWLAIAFAWLLVMAVLRSGGATGRAVAIAQLIPTASLVLALALLLELAGSSFGPAAGDNASGVGLAIAVARALDVAPPRRLSVEVVLQGAGDGTMIGLSRYLRSRRRELEPANTIVVGIGPCGAGRPCWWTSDGALVGLRYLNRLTEIANRAVGPTTSLGATPRRGRGITPALPARAAGLPAITIGCLDSDGLAPRSHQAGDVQDRLDRGSIDRLLELALTLVDAIDADLRPSHRQAPTSHHQAPPGTTRHE